MKKTAPEFPEGAQLKAVWKNKKTPYVLISGPAAEHPDFVYGYKVAVSVSEGKEWKKADDLICYGGFYAGLNFPQKNFTIQIPHAKKTKRGQAFEFTPGARYRFEVTPVESFGTAGKPLCAELTVPKAE